MDNTNESGSNPAGAFQNGGAFLRSWPTQVGRFRPAAADGLRRPGRRRATVGAKRLQSLSSLGQCTIRQIAQKLKRTPTRPATNEVLVLAKPTAADAIKLRLPSFCSNDPTRRSHQGFLLTQKHRQRRRGFCHAIGCVTLAAGFYSSSNTGCPVRLSSSGPMRPSASSSSISRAALL